MMDQLVIHEVRDFMIGNRLPVAFSTRMVEPEKLICVLEGASRTPSHLDLQPWNFIIATRDDSTEYERLVSCLAEANVEWARRAPVLMLSVVRLNSGSNGERNVHAFRDSRHAMSNLVIRARAMGLAAQPISGFDTTKVRERFQIPAGFAPTTGIALGYPIDVKGSSVGANGGAIKSGRPFESFVFTGRWGRPSPLSNRIDSKLSGSAGIPARSFGNGDSISSRSGKAGRDACAPREERPAESRCSETSVRYSGAV